MITKGEWIRDYRGTTGHIKAVVKGEKILTPTIFKYMDYAQGSISEEEQSCNVDFVCTAGTVANKLYDMGYDGQAAIEALPEIISAFERCLSEMQGGDLCEHGDSATEAAYKLLDKAKGKINEHN